MVGVPTSVRLVNVGVHDVPKSPVNAWLKNNIQGIDISFPSEIGVVIGGGLSI